MTTRSIALAFSDDGEARLGRSRALSVWRWQFILMLTATIIAFIFVIISPQLFASVGFLFGMALLLLITFIAVFAPWHRIHRDHVFALPLADTFAIGVAALAVDGLGVSLLWLFPLIWAATYYSGLRVAVVLAVISGFLVYDSVINEFRHTELVEAFVVLTSLSLVAVAIVLGSRRTEAAERLLRHQSRQLQRALSRVKEQESQVLKLLDALPNGIAWVDPLGTIRTSNRAYRDIYGLGTDPGHPARSVEYRTRRGEPMPPRETTLMRAASGTLTEPELIWLFDVEGQWRALEVSARHVDDNGTVVTVTDVTEAALAEGSRASLARTISHELRNPLTAVLGYADLLRERTDLPTSAHTQVEGVGAAAERMQHLISHSLAAPEDSGDDDEQVFDLGEVARASVAAFTPLAVASGVSIAADELDELVMVGDEFRIRQVIDNLVSNAVKYTDRGGSVVVSKIYEEGTIGLAVSDSGIGIHEEDLVRVFDPYFRAEAATASDRPGTGLGLAIVRTIVTDNGGSVQLRSDPGRGTVAEVRFTGLNSPPAPQERTS